MGGSLAGLWPRTAAPSVSIWRPASGSCSGWTSAAASPCTIACGGPIGAIIRRRENRSGRRARASATPNEGYSRTDANPGCWNFDRRTPCVRAKWRLERATNDGLEAQAGYGGYVHHRFDRVPSPFCTPPIAPSAPSRCVQRFVCSIRFRVAAPAIPGIRCAAVQDAAAFTPRNHGLCASTSDALWHAAYALRTV
jgi:hypothetical protein